MSDEKDKLADLVLASALIGKASALAGTYVVQIWTAELFPTVIRWDIYKIHQKAQPQYRDILLLCRTLTTSLHALHIQQVEKYHKSRGAITKLKYFKK